MLGPASPPKRFPAQWGSSGYQRPMNTGECYSGVNAMLARPCQLNSQRSCVFSRSWVAPLGQGRHAVPVAGRVARKAAATESHRRSGSPANGIAPVRIARLTAYLTLSASCASRAAIRCWLRLCAKPENRNASGRKHRKAGTQAPEPTVTTCVTRQMPLKTAVKRNGSSLSLPTSGLPFRWTP